MTVDLELWKFVIMQGGLLFSAVGCFMWGRGEQKERREVQQKYNALGVKSVEADFTVAAAMNKLTDAINANRRS